MEITNRIISALAGLNKSNNSVSPDPNSFLKYGNRKVMPSTWSTPEITDQDFYNGYGFAVINKRANRSVVLGKKFIYTEARDEIIARANEKGVRVIHPYIDLIRNSIDFSERDFWYDISTYLDLEGVYYLMAVRTVLKNGTVGKIQKFTLLNPYWVKPVINSDGDLGGYVESNPHLGQREIPKEMIIPIKLLNPFDPTKPFSLADAARDSQFTLKQANDFAREAIDGNLNSPGILSSAIELPDDQFDNFVDRVKNHGRGEPLFGNGSGTVTWVDMQTDLDKAALDKINSINRDVLLGISGLSKTGIGVEESGTGREVSRSQKDDFTENAIMPQIENIIDALNLDYRKYYASEYQKNGYSISLDNPLEANHEAEQADVAIRQSQFDLMQTALKAGYSYDIAAKYAKGLIGITDLGEASETEKEEEPPVPPVDEDPIVEENSSTPIYENIVPEQYEAYPVPVVQYLGDLADQIVPQSEVGSTVYAVAKHDIVRIKHVAEFYQNLIGVVDDNTYVHLAEFKPHADRVAIIAKLNKRYKNQPVAIKKKIKLEHNCSSGIYEKVRNAAFDAQAQIDTNTADLLFSAAAVEGRLFNWYVNELSQGNNNPHPTNLDEFINSLALPFSVYFTLMFPIYAQARIQETASQLGVRDELPIVTLTDEIKQSINDFAKRDATSHINTIKTDIENALARIKAQTSDPQEVRRLFDQAFADIQRKRSIVIANHAAARIYNMSNYEADLQLLTRAGMVDRAYKSLFSLTGNPCPFCNTMIAMTNSRPVPFKEAFAELGDEIEAGGKTMAFNYEKITAGNLHPNCHCAYRLIIDEV